MTIFSDERPLALAVTIAVLWTAESLAPHFAAFSLDARARWVHGFRNAALGLTNGLLGTVFLGAMIAVSIRWAEAHDLGLTRWLMGPEWGKALVALLFFDAWMYWWHRINHTMPFLWRFHRVHHSDPRMDVSTSLRFHPGEIVLSTAARLIVVALLGMELWHLALYELIAAQIVAFHHSNVNLPRRVDNALRWLMVTPWMHWVHHSRLFRETNSNYSSVLSIWDRIFGSYRFREDAEMIRFGLDGFPDEQTHQSLSGMLRTPIG